MYGNATGICVHGKTTSLLGRIVFLRSLSFSGTEKGTEKRKAQRKMNSFPFIHYPKHNAATGYAGKTNGFHSVKSMRKRNAVACRIGAVRRI